MRILIVAARFPEPGHKGDQVRTWQQVELLAERHQLTVLTAGAPSSSQARRALEDVVDLVSVPAGATVRALSAASSSARGRPVEVGWMMPRPAMARAVALARLHDVALVSTVRCLPRPLPVPVVLDHIDALSANLAQRAQLERHGALRWAARIESRLLAEHERRVASWVAAQIVVSRLDAELLAPEPIPEVVPHVMAVVDYDPAAATRDIDVIFTGDMRYPPNREAAVWLAGAIAPALRRRRPEVRVVVAGRAADRLGVTGVEVVSDVPDLRAVIRRARVAAVPLRSGTGVANKLLEAAAAGAAVVASPRAGAASGLDVDTAADAESFAAAIDQLLADEDLRQDRAVAALAGLQDRRPEVVRAQLERILTAAAETRLTKQHRGSPARSV